MTRRIGEDARAVGRWLMVELRCTQGQHGPLGRIEVFYPKVQVNCMDEAGSGHVGGWWFGDRWNDRWKLAFSLWPTEYQSGSL